MFMEFSLLIVMKIYTNRIYIKYENYHFIFRMLSTCFISWFRDSGKMIQNQVKNQVFYLNPGTMFYLYSLQIIRKDYFMTGSSVNDGIYHDMMI